MQKRRSRVPLIIAVVASLVLGGAAGGGLAVWLRGDGGAKPVAVPPAGDSGASAALPQSGDEAAPEVDEPAADWPDLSTVTARDYDAIALPEEMRAMWISFLEMRDLIDFTSEEAFTADVTGMFDGCKAMGLNTVIVTVRPFGDALYQSDIFPWSHVMNGTQGQDPGFDPLAIMVAEGHARGLRVEAWINPYRILDVKNGPGALSDDNPAAQNPELVRDVGGNLWYDPGLPAVRRMVVEGVLEIVQNYDVDGIHFDDYFYPEFTAEQQEDGTATQLDAETYEAHNPDGLDLAGWRRENVNTLVWHVYEAIKTANPTASFGISPQGNNENNYKSQYSDVKHWMANDGYVDYVMPQLYWGFGYLTASGRENYAFENIVAEWAFYPRIDGVRLYAGLGAYRIGAGDGGAGDQAEWQSGRNLADMVQALRAADGFSGFALFRYEFLYDNPDYPELGLSEVEALTEMLA